MYMPFNCDRRSLNNSIVFSAQFRRQAFAWAHTCTCEGKSEGKTPQFRVVATQPWRQSLINASIIRLCEGHQLPALKLFISPVRFL